MTTPPMFLVKAFWLAPQRGDVQVVFRWFPNDSDLGHTKYQSGLSFRCVLNNRQKA